jgi:VanZ family protein
MRGLLNTLSQLHRSQNPKLWGTMFGGWLLGVFFLSSMTGSQVPQVSTGLPLDKIAHFLIYAFGAYLLLRLLWAWLGDRVPLIVLAPLLVIIPAGVGALDEFYQTFTPGRSGLDLGDWFANLAGALSVALGTVLWVKFRTRYPVVHTRKHGNDT